jgi:hypothetical protein
VAALHDPAHGVAGGGRGGELGGQHQLLGRLGAQSEDGPYDDAQRALGADEQAGQVVAGDALGGAAAGGHEAAVREDDVEAEDVLGGHPVLHAAQAAGGRADVAADGAHLPAGGIRRVVQAVFADGPGQGGVDDAGFDDGDAVDRVDLQDPVHPGQGEHDAAVGGVGCAGQAGAGALRDDRDAQGGGGAHHVLDLLDRTGQHDDGRRAGRAEARHVVGVGGRDVGVGEDRFGGQAAEQQVQEVAGRCGVLGAGRFDTAHDHRFAPGAIGVNPVGGTLHLPGCGRRTDAQ